MIVDKTELADIAGVSTNTISEWIKRGCTVLQNGGNGVPYQIDSGDALWWHFDLVIEEKITKTGCSYAEGRIWKRQVYSDLGVLDRLT